MERLLPVGKVLPEEDHGCRGDGKPLIEVFMKVLLSGHHNPNYWTVTEYIEEAIRSLRHELWIVDEGHHLVPGRLRQRAPFIERVDLRWFNRQLLRASDRFRPDLFIASGGERLLPSTVVALRKGGIRTALWTADVPLHFVPILRSAPAYEHVFCQGTEALDILREGGIQKLFWLPMACDPVHHRPVELSAEERDRYGHDVVFVGSHYPMREKLFEALAGLDLAIWGPGWDRLRSDSPLRGCVRAAHTTPDTWRQIYAAAKIVLSVHFQDPLGKIPCHQASPRVFEALACGAFVITDRQKDVMALFRDGEHLVSFADDEDLRRKVETYLGCSNERERIAQNGRAEVLARHTYRERLSVLFGSLDSAGAKRDATSHGKERHAA
jgi:spore maturation protein CgeB